VVKDSYDPVDIVTEVDQPREHALANSLVPGAGKVVALGAALARGCAVKSSSRLLATLACALEAFKFPLVLADLRPVFLA